MTERFLTNQTYPLLIAKIAVTVQFFFTVSIIYVLISLIGAKPTIVLINLLLLDILFICMHASYRISYRGPKVILPSMEKWILLGHILSSLFALSLSLLLAFAPIVYFSLATISIFLWGISLLLGVVFFFGKYRKIEE